MLPSCKMDDRMAQIVLIWSARKPIVSKHRRRSRKSCWSFFPCSSQAPPCITNIAKQTISTMYNWMQGYVIDYQICRHSIFRSLHFIRLHSHLVEVVVSLGSLQVEILLVPLIHPSQQLIKHMIVPFLFGLQDRKDSCWPSRLYIYIYKLLKLQISTFFKCKNKKQ